MGEIQGKRILVIDDDPDLRRLVEIGLAKAGAQVCTAAGGEEGLRQFWAHRPHLVILDIMMPDMDGWQVCHHIRQISEVPVIFLTALDGEENAVRGLDLGAIDYMTKPISLKVLVARVQAALRRVELDGELTRGTAYQDDYLMVDLDTRQVLVDGHPVRLRATEFKLLAYLLVNASRVVTFDQILEAVWDWEHCDNANYVHVYIWHLRKKLEADPKNPRYLLTEHGVGYRFQKQPPPETA